MIPKSGISACLIVRDEARFISDCLTSLAGKVDEIILIDTGSTDETLAIASHFAVTIGHFQWCDDFSAARNFALAQAHHEWILYIDADERLSIPDDAAWRACLADASKAAYRLRLHPKLNWTAYAELRIFRNDPRIRFTGEIHERVHDAVDEVCRDDKLTVGEINVALHHVGYEDDQSPKLPRNIPLLQRYLARDPSRIYCWWHLGEQYRVAGDLAAAMRTWESAIAAVRARYPGPTPMWTSPSYLSLIAAREQAGLAFDDLLDEGLRRFPNHLSLQWMQARRVMAQGDISSAQSTFERLAAINPDDFFEPELAFDCAIFTHLAQESLAIAAFRMGDFAAAAAHYTKAAATAPNPAPLKIKASLAKAKISESVLERDDIRIALDPIHL